MLPPLHGWRLSFKQNTIWLKDRDVAMSATSRVTWCPTGATTCIDEARTDPGVATQLDQNNGYLCRRVKHFSGYTVAAD